MRDDIRRCAPRASHSRRSRRTAVCMMLDNETRQRQRAETGGLPRNHRAVLKRGLPRRSIATPEISSPQWHNRLTGGWVLGVAAAVLSGVVVVLVTSIARRLIHARGVRRQQRRRPQARVDRSGLSVHLKMVWLMQFEAVDARLTPMRPVRQTSSGGSLRGVLTRGDSIEAVFRWDDSNKSATATLTWREQGSLKDRSETLDLAKLAKPT